MTAWDTAKALEKVVKLISFPGNKSTELLLPPGGKNIGRPVETQQKNEVFYPTLLFAISPNVMLPNHIHYLNFLNASRITTAISLLITPPRYSLFIIREIHLLGIALLPLVDSVIVKVIRLSEGDVPLWASQKNQQKLAFLFLNN